MKTNSKHRKDSIQSGSPHSGKETIKPTHRRLFFPVVSGILVALLFVFLAVIYVLGFELQISDWLLIGIILLIMSCLILMLPLIFREAALRCPIRIYYGCVTLWVLMFVTGAGLVLSAILPSREEEKSAASLLCRLHLKSLERAMNNYADKFGGRYPDPAKWCDLLMKEIKVPPALFVCPYAALARCNYAVNPNCGPDSPGEVILLFETKDGWNRHGGPELMSFDNHGDGNCHVLFKDGIIVFVKREVADKLNWGTRPGEIKQKLEAGDEAPQFKLLDQDGQMVSLSDFTGKKILVYFYPKADTPGCTKQACSVRDSAEELKEAGVVPLGISPDEPNEQRKFDEKYSLGFILLSDADHKAAEAYSVWNEKSGGINRSSFLIDEQGRLIGVWYNVKPEDTVPEAMGVLGR